MSNLLQLVTTGAPAALTFIKGYLNSPVIGGEKVSDKYRIGKTQFEGLKGGILIEPEQYIERNRADVSSQMILSTSGNKQYITDNIAVHPRTWDITGYIPAEIYEVSALFAPSLKKKKGKLQKIFNSRALTWLKTREGEFVQVAIESIEFETRASVANKQPISITLKEVVILDVNGGDTNAKGSPQPEVKSESGRPMPTGVAPVSKSANTSAFLEPN